MTQKYSYNKNSNKTIWVDLDNSPHVPFFAPIIARLRAEGYCIKISARNYSQTVSLADLYDFDYTAIGKHHGKNKFIKILGLFYRSIQLLPFAFRSKAILAISHGSRSQMIVAYLLRIPIVMFLDYEFIQTIPFVKPKLVFLPNIISTNKLKSFGTKVFSYPGIKEDIYVPGFVPDPSIKKHLDIAQDTITVVLRPPAHQAHYHNPESEKLFEAIINFLTNIGSVKTFILPRDDRQKQAILEIYDEHFKNDSLIIPDDVLDGLNLMWYSDLVISGGGTMNREAAALGVPVYSIFKGKIGDVDKHLSQAGRLILIENIKDIKKKIRIKKRNKSDKVQNLNSLALQSIVNNLESFISDISETGETHKAKTNHEQQLSISRKFEEQRNYY
jgi:uncharacterized protein